MSQQNIILIGGPTATGKSALALEIAKQRNGNIINADAMQVYAGLPILTAQPSAIDRTSVPHYLYEVTDAAEGSSVGQWLVQAQRAIAETRANGRVPILVGGTGLYFAALLEGLTDIPAIPSAINITAEHFYEAWGEEKFRAALARQDPISATRIARNDRQRLIRAYAVITHTGKSLSEWHKEGNKNSYQEEILEQHLLLPAREKLYASCDQRFLMMVEHGAIDEVRNLLARQLSPALPAMKILGVREIAAHLHGEITLKEAIAKGQQMTRNYAKRQMTWFRNKWRDSTPRYGKQSINIIHTD